MKDLYRHVRDGARSLATALAGGTADPIRALTATTLVDSALNIVENTGRRLVGQKIATEAAIEVKYDRLAGSYIRRAFGDESTEEGLYCVDGSPRTITHGEFQRIKTQEYADVLAELDWHSALEVGAGELTTLVGVARAFPDRTYSAIDASFPCLWAGKRHFEQATHMPVTACKGSAVALPFPDRSFDLVFTSGCLTVMPLTYEMAVREMIRVSRAHIVLFEPSYELGSPVQKLRMRGSGYVRGLPSLLKRIPEIRMHEPRLLKNGAVYTRLGCFVLEKKDRAAISPNVQPPYACPACRERLDNRDAWLQCRCGLVYSIVDNIPILDTRRAVSMNVQK